MNSTIRSGFLRPGLATAAAVELMSGGGAVRLAAPAVTAEPSYPAVSAGQAATPSGDRREKRKLGIY
jgi:hypothetical protein